MRYPPCMRTALLLGAALATSLWGCGGANVDPCRDTPTYTADIAPLLSQRCLGCHSSELMDADRQGAPEGLNLDSLEAVMAAGTDRVADEITSGRMPPTQPEMPLLTTKEERNLVSRWRMCDFP